MVIFVVVLFTLITFFVIEKKGPGAVPEFEYPGITDDKYVIIIDKTKGIDATDVNEILKKGGAVEVAEQ
jgi:hypothetical protein